MKYLLFICMMLIGKELFAQDSSVQAPPDTAQAITPKLHIVRRIRVPRKDSTLVKDSLHASIVATDSSALKPSRRPLVADTNIVFPSWLSSAPRSFFRFTDPLAYSITIKQWEGKEPIFYSMIALLIFFALIKNGFHRYIEDLFKTFFRTSVKQRQLKEQLLQSPLPSLLLNIFFLLAAGMFLALVLQHFNLAASINFWMLFLYCMLGLVAVYGVKYLSLKLLGWIFQVAEVIDGYIFIVFTTNKIISIALLPFLVVMAFTYGFVNEAAMNLSLVVVLCLFAYRFFLSYVSLRRQISISFFHFFLYLCAFEVAPLILINKLLFRFLGETP